MLVTHVGCIISDNSLKFSYSVIQIGRNNKMSATSSSPCTCGLQYLRDGWISNPAWFYYLALFGFFRIACLIPVGISIRATLVREQLPSCLNVIVLCSIAVRCRISVCYLCCWTRVYVCVRFHVCWNILSCHLEINKLSIVVSVFFSIYF